MQGLRDVRFAALGQEDEWGGRGIRQLGAVHREPFLQDGDKLWTEGREIHCVPIDLRATGPNFEIVASEFQVPVPRRPILPEMPVELHLAHVPLAQGYPHEQLEDHPALKAAGPLLPRKLDSLPAGTSGARPSARQDSATSSSSARDTM